MNRLLIVILFVCLAASVANAGQLIDEDFDDQSLSPLAGYPSENVSIVEFASARSGNYVARMYGGYLGARLDYTISSWSPPETLYVKWYQYWPSSWSWSSVSASGQKNYRLVSTDSAMPSAMYKYTDVLRTHGYFYLDTSELDCLYESCSSMPSLSIPTANQWHKIEIAVKYTTDGTGGWYWKIDDVVVEGGEVWNHVTWPPAQSYNIIAVGVAGGNGFPSGDYYYVDDLEIWDEIPGETPEDPPTVISVGGSGSVSFGGAP